MRVEEEVDAPRHLFSSGAGHRVEHNGGLLALKAVHSSHAHACRHPVANALDGEIVWRYDEDIAGHDWARVAFVVGHGGACENFVASRGDCGRLFRAGLASTSMVDGDGAQAAAGDGARCRYATECAGIPRPQASIVTALGDELTDFGMHPPGFGEQNTEMSWHCMYPIEDVLED